MIRDEYLQRTDIGEKAHLVDGRDDSIDGFILVWLHDDGRVAHPKCHTTKTVLNDPFVDVVDSDDGYNVAKTTITAPLNLTVQLETQMVPKLRAEKLGL